MLNQVSPLRISTWKGFKSLAGSINGTLLYVKRAPFTPAIALKQQTISFQPFFLRAVNCRYTTQQCILNCFFFLTKIWGTFLCLFKDKITMEITPRQRKRIPRGTVRKILYIRGYLFLYYDQKETHVVVVKRYLPRIFIVFLLAILFYRIS